MAHSKGNWKVGIPGTVVTDNPEGFPENSGHSGKEATDYYGGNLICESILRKEDAKLIAAAPEMLEALKGIIEYWNTPQNGNLSLNDNIEHTLKVAKSVIKKATE